jgi:transposase
MARCRVYSLELKQEVAQRLVNGESVSALHDELGIRRGVLYRWRDVYRKEGAAGLRLTGRPSGVEGAPRDGNTQESARRIAELERKIGQQALDLDFLTRAFKRVKESRQKNTGTGETASTEKSEA